MEFDGYYLESDPCLVCNNPEVPFCVSAVFNVGSGEACRASGFLVQRLIVATWVFLSRRLVTSGMNAYLPRLPPQIEVSSVVEEWVTVISFEEGRMSRWP